MKGTLSNKKLNYEIWLLLAKTRYTILRLRQKELRRYGISAMNAGILHTIHEVGGKVTPLKISEQLSRAPNSVSELLSRMEKKGLLKKFKDLEWKNRIRIEMTEEGREIYTKSVKRESIHEIMSSLSQEELQQLQSSLQKLLARALSIEAKLR